MKFSELYQCLPINEHVGIDIMKSDDNWYSLEYCKKKEIDINALKDMEVIEIVSVMCDYEDCCLYVVLKESD